jgi:chaperonin cofactor prefoldin
MGKTIKQIAAELDISKQAVWQRVKRSEELSALLETHAETVNGTIYVDADLEQCIKAMYPDRLTPFAVDGNTVNMSAPVDETAVNVDGSTVNMSVPVDETAVNVDVNALVETLQNTVNTLKQQLMEKDTQLAGLTAALSEAQQVQIQLSSALETAQQTQKQLTDALAAAQALHAGTIQMQQQQVQQQQPETPVVDAFSGLDPEGMGDAMVQSYSEKKKHRGFFARLFGRE